MILHVNLFLWFYDLLTCFKGDSVRVQFPKLPGHFTGTGDLFTALLLAWSEEGLQVCVGGGGVHTYVFCM